MKDLPYDLLKTTIIKLLIICNNIVGHELTEDEKVNILNNAKGRVPEGSDRSNIINNILLAQ